MKKNHNFVDIFEFIKSSSKIIKKYIFIAFSLFYYCPPILLKFLVKIITGAILGA